MDGFYCLPSPRVRRGRRFAGADGGGVDLYAPGTPEFRKRTRETRTEIAPGMIRVDLGEPIPRQTHEPRPVTVEAPEEPEAAPTAPNQPPPAPAPSRKPSPPKDWRADFGVLRER